MPADPNPLSDLRFCHLVVGVTDMDRALSFYRELLGMDVVFDRFISAEPFRVTAAGYQPEQAPFEIGGVRMFFVKDPDGTPVEFIELPGGARNTYELYR
jgi:catechol 2,3-dioxygenase-like lactoylglutathione lyase family enzyme